MVFYLSNKQCNITENPKKSFILTSLKHLSTKNIDLFCYVKFLFTKFLWIFYCVKFKSLFVNHQCILLPFLISIVSFFNSIKILLVVSFNQFSPKSLK